MLLDPAVVTCETDSCLNGGICSSRLNEIECLCPSGFTGPRCQIDIDDCHNVTCPSNSRCVDGTDSHQCVCLDGFSGVPSTGCVNINECESNPCRNNGSCTDLVNGFDCVCPAGFSGDDCSTEVDECDPSPCLNGATCTDSVGNYTCHCATGFEGRDCQIDVDECASSPCIHSTTCTDLVGDYRCVCEPGWTGRHCDSDVDECADSPCLNNGTCSNQLNSFQCTCHNGFLGIFGILSDPMKELLFIDFVLCLFFRRVLRFTQVNDARSTATTACPICAGITGRASIKWPITRVSARVNSWDAIARKNLMPAPVLRAKMAPVVSPHDPSRISTANAFQVISLLAAAIFKRRKLKKVFILLFQKVSRECTAKTTSTNVSRFSASTANNVSI